MLHDSHKRRQEMVRLLQYRIGTVFLHLLQGQDHLRFSKFQMTEHYQTITGKGWWWSCALAVYSIISWLWPENGRKKIPQTLKIECFIHSIYSINFRSTVIRLDRQIQKIPQHIKTNPAIFIHFSFSYIKNMILQIEWSSINTLHQLLITCHMFRW